MYIQPGSIIQSSYIILLNVSTDINYNPLPKLINRSTQGLWPRLLYARGPLISCPLPAQFLCQLIKIGKSLYSKIKILYEP